MNDGLTGSFTVYRRERQAPIGVRVPCVTENGVRKQPLSGSFRDRRYNQLKMVRS
jgi:hypothetical protein